MNWVRQWYNETNESWREAFADERFKRYFLLNFLVCFVVFFSVVHWLQVNSSRDGRVLSDPVYPFLTPHDFSWAIFFMTYTGAILLIFHILQYPKLMHRAITGFAAMFVIRAVCIYLVPLSPSPGLIPLHDPYTSAVAGEDRIYNDLFFSGHVGDLVFFYFLAQSLWLRRYLLFCSVAVAVLLVWQRVHYTLDVMAAPLFAYLSYWIFVSKDLIWGAVLKKPALE